MPINRLAELSAALDQAIREFHAVEWAAWGEGSEWQAEAWAERICALEDCARIIAALP